LRAISRDDLPAFVNWLNDPEVGRYISIYYPFSAEMEEVWFRDILTHPVEEQPLAIEIKENDQ
jgi:RimJ/RimL family protein N-acetyltransferase